MRPRHKAAENGGHAGPSTARDDSASMRPRHKAAENWACSRSAILWISPLQ